MQGVLQGVLKVQHNAGGTTSKKKEGVQPSTQSYTSLSTMLQGDIPASKQASKQNILGKTLQGVEGYSSYSSPSLSQLSYIRGQAHGLILFSF